MKQLKICLVPASISYCSFTEVFLDTKMSSVDALGKFRALQNPSCGYYCLLVYVKSWNESVLYINLLCLESLWNKKKKLLLNRGLVNDKSNPIKREYLFQQRAAHRGLYNTLSTFVIKISIQWEENCQPRVKPLTAPSGAGSRHRCCPLSFL